MSRADVIKEFSALKGVGKAKAELLYDHGFTSIEKLHRASVKDLTKIKGITEKNAKELTAQFAEKKPKTTKKPAKETKPVKKTTEAKSTEKPAEEEKPAAKKEADVEIVEPGTGSYHVKIKPTLSDELKKGLILRTQVKQRSPRFLREEWFRYRRLPMNWRKPDGVTSKMRIHLGYRPNVVSVGFRGPKKTRGLHPSGFEEVMVHSVMDLSKINPKTQAARIGGTVGTKKRGEIMKKAGELDIRVLNMKV